MFENTPRGELLPVDCTYTFSQGKEMPDPLDLPVGWTMTWILSDDPAPGEAGFEIAAFYLGEVDGKPVASFRPFEGAEALAYAYLVNEEAELVATWDEGRWWTPDESAAFRLMLHVPSTYVVAEGLRRSGLNREMRRRKR